MDPVDEQMSDLRLEDLYPDIPEPNDKELAIIRCDDAISNKAMISFIRASSGGGPGLGSCRDIPYNLTPEQSKPVFEALRKVLRGL